ncbi:zinc ribbon domain-containing protein [Halostella litorea]|uniref:zinc ribbon domain-containing protein n=1 Tax=Halostella litorea TaxID=2528831 RepID=UPI0010921434|nr:zinc ribbon domain-containing protein [Halostella litorea]
MSRLRSALAVGLSVLFPGLGHAYLRQWVRALLWAALSISASALLMPEPATSGTVIERATATVEAMSRTETFVLLSVTLFAAIDAFVISVRQANYDPDAVHCPNCGNEIDEELDFCHWCTSRIGEPADEAEGPAT